MMTKQARPVGGGGGGGGGGVGGVCAAGYGSARVRGMSGLLVNERLGG
jgi:hypothetical protein